MIIRLTDKHEWYTSLIKAGCPERLLKVAWTLLDFIDGQEESDRYGWAYPTIEQIRERTGKSPSKISEATKELAEFGWILKEVVQRQSGRKTFYNLAIGDCFPGVTKKGNVNNLKQFASPVDRKSHLPQEGICISRNQESATTQLRDDKHKQETPTETVTKKETYERGSFYLDLTGKTQRVLSGGLSDLNSKYSAPTDKYINEPRISRSWVVPKNSRYNFMRSRYV